MGRAEPMSAAILRVEAVEGRRLIRQFGADTRRPEQAPTPAHHRESPCICCICTSRRPAIDQRDGKPGLRGEDRQRRADGPRTNDREFTGGRGVEACFRHVKEVAMLHRGVQRWHRIGRLAASVHKL